MHEKLLSIASVHIKKETFDEMISCVKSEGFTSVSALIEFLYYFYNQVKVDPVLSRNASIELLYNKGRNTTPTPEKLKREFENLVSVFPNKAGYERAWPIYVNKRMEGVMYKTLVEAVKTHWNFLSATGKMGKESESFYKWLKYDMWRRKHDNTIRKFNEKEDRVVPLGNPDWSKNYLENLKKNQENTDK